MKGLLAKALRACWPASRMVTCMLQTKQLRRLYSRLYSSSASSASLPRSCQCVQVVEARAVWLQESTASLQRWRAPCRTPPLHRTTECWPSLAAPPALLATPVASGSSCLESLPRSALVQGASIIAMCFVNCCLHSHQSDGLHAAHSHAPSNMVVSLTNHQPVCMQHIHMRHPAWL